MPIRASCITKGCQCGRWAPVVLAPAVKTNVIYIGSCTCPSQSSIAWDAEQRRHFTRNSELGKICPHTSRDLKRQPHVCDSRPPSPSPKVSPSRRRRGQDELQQPRAVRTANRFRLDDVDVERSVRFQIERRSPRAAALVLLILRRVLGSEVRLGVRTWTTRAASRRWGRGYPLTVWPGSASLE